ncbi:hypothetical protein Y032_0656g1225 [Ancylostoma ceylanicum]|uniref:Uncharacterized protein n=1 Tax=Ancylostoma ceylanicum TaxID=53326 RepID=A0A016WIG9_9BILA|nr:hypothetical protein Y032_0656g1225 [Ancylostoma ceylanicum]
MGDSPGGKTLYAALREWLELLSPPNFPDGVEISSSSDGEVDGSPGPFLERSSSSESVRIFVKYFGGGYSG